MSACVLAAIVVMLIASDVGAAPVLIADINVTPTGNGGSDPVVAGGTVFFVGTDEAHGAELWKTDGTVNGTVLVKDLVPGPDGSSPSGLLDVGGRLFFLTGEYGVALDLWRSDGTPEGTVWLTSLFPGDWDGMYEPANFTAVGTALYFSAFDQSSEMVQLWRSDGTPSGTGVVQVVAPPEAADGAIEGLMAVGEVLYFTVDDVVHGTELWRSDGTATGTIMVKDIRPGELGSRPHPIAALGTTLFFGADDGVRGDELWKTDGTTAGTVLVKDIRPGIDAAFPYADAPVALGGYVYFSANDGTTGTELWRSDGTAAGTAKVVDLTTDYYGSFPRSFAVWHERLLFAAFDELWVTDGTAAGTMRLRALIGGPAAGGLIDVGGTSFFFVRRWYPTQIELWRTDGTAVGTTLVASLAPPASDVLGSAAGADGKLFFAVTDPTAGTELWESDGTAAGTHIVRDILAQNLGSDPRVLGRVPGGVVFVADDGVHGAELWRTDGTAAGTALMKDIVPGSGGSGAYVGVEIPGGLLFGAGNALWRTDGTTAGTVRVRDVASGPIDSSTSGPATGQFVQLGSVILYASGNGSNDVELWRTDGTGPGTVRVKDIRPGALGSGPTHLTRMDGAVYFVADDFTHGEELWRTDGTAAGTTLVKDITPGSLGSYATALTAFEGVLYFAAYVPTAGGRELWRSDGTAAGTYLVSDLDPGSDSAAPESLVVVNGALVFGAGDAEGERHLWRTDGTPAGTVRIADVAPATFSGDVPRGIMLGTTWMFLGYDAAHGGELWRTDGTAAGTMLVRDLAPGGRDGWPESFVGTGDRVYFSADDGMHGEELWTSDGTPAGTTLVRDFRPGLGGYSRAFLEWNGTLFLTADDGHAGSELWALPPCGDGTVNPAEQCDDGNLVAGDCCSSACTVEPVGQFCTDDLNGCTDDRCDGSGTCAHVPNTALCDDGIFCNGADACHGGSCAMHGGDPCPGADADGDCAESCAEASRDCTAPDPDGSACTDGVFCDGADYCTDGTCATHTGDPCPGPDGDGNCRESCDEAAAACTAADPTGTPCSDGLFCTVSEACDDTGACAGALRDCGADLDQCHGGICDEATRQCVGPAKPDGSNCDDGDLCTASDACSAGTCGGELDLGACLSAFECRGAKTASGTARFTPVGGVVLDDGTFVARTLASFCAPAVRGGGTVPGTLDPFVAYRIVAEAGTPAHARERVTIADAFGTVSVDTVKPELLLLRGRVGADESMAPSTERYACRRVKLAPGSGSGGVGATIPVHDTATGAIGPVALKRPRHLCVPIVSTAGAPAPASLLCYQAKRRGGAAKPPSTSVTDAFGSLVVTAGKTEELCLPAVGRDP